MFAYGQAFEHAYEIKPVLFAWESWLDLREEVTWATAASPAWEI